MSVWEQPEWINPGALTTIFQQMLGPAIQMQQVYPCVSCRLAGCADPLRTAMYLFCCARFLLLLFSLSLTITSSWKCHSSCLIAFMNWTYIILIRIPKAGLHYLTNINWKCKYCLQVCKGSNVKLQPFYLGSRFHYAWGQGLLKSFVLTGSICSRQSPFCCYVLLVISFLSLW